MLAKLISVRDPSSQRQPELTMHWVVRSAVLPGYQWQSELILNSLVYIPYGAAGRIGAPNPNAAIPSLMITLTFGAFKAEHVGHQDHA